MPCEKTNIQIKLYTKSFFLTWQKEKKEKRN